VKILAITLLMMGYLTGCSDPGTGPVDVHWDRDSCERCNMILSDRHHAAQVRYMDEQNRSRVRIFDDIGCALVWLEDKQWRDAATTEIWTKDYRDGKWIDAKAAYYIKGQVTPMEYGVGAQSTPPIAESFNFDEAKSYIFKVEETYNVHGANIKEHSKEVREIK